MDLQSAFSQALQQFKTNLNKAGEDLVSRLPSYTISSSRHPDLPQQPVEAPKVNEQIPKIESATRLVLDTPISTESARAYIKNILTGYKPTTPDVYPDWKTPLAEPQYIEKMAQLTHQYNLHPALQPLLAIAETQLLRPGAAGTSKLNPYNIRPAGELFDYSNPEYGLGYALERLPYNITKNWTSENWEEFRKNPTLQKLIFTFNPVDDPTGELNTILRIASQLGI